MSNLNNQTTPDIQMIWQCYGQNPQPFLLLRSETNENGTQKLQAVYGNQAFYALTKSDPTTLEGTPYQVLFQDNTLQHTEQLLAIATEGGSIQIQLSNQSIDNLTIRAFQLMPGFCGCLLSQDSQPDIYTELEKLDENLSGGLLVIENASPYRLLYINQFLYLLLGYGTMAELQDESESATIYSFIHPEDLEKAKEALHSMTDIGFAHCVLRVQKKNADYLWLSLRGKCRMLAGVPVLILTAHEIGNEIETIQLEGNISHQVNLNLAAQYYALYYLEAASGHYRLVFHDSRLEQPHIPTEGDHILATRKYLEELVHPDDREKLLRLTNVRELIRCSRQCGNCRVLNVQFRRKCGGVYEWVEMYLSINAADRPEQRLVTLAFRNIHEEKLAELAHRYLDVIAYAIADTYDAVLEYDTRCNSLFELQMTDDGLRRSQRCRASSEVVTQMAKECIHPDDMNAFLEEFHPDRFKKLSKGQAITREYRRHCPDGRYHWCSYSMRCFMQNGRKLYILFVKDIHETKMRVLQQQAELRQAIVEAEQRALEKTQQLFTYYGKTIELMSSVVEYRSLESGEHVKRIKNYTKELLQAAIDLYPEQHLTAEKIQSITEASALHDVGKIGVPDGILLKPGRLTKDEFEVMKRHTLIGSDIAKEIPFVAERKAEYNYGYNIARYHHERFDGKGYPEGLQGDQIPFCAQIVAIADVFDALTTKRVYKDAYSKEKAYEMIMNGECGTFAPKMLECFARVRERFNKLVQTDH